MSLDLGRYELVMRPSSGVGREYSIGEFTFAVKPGRDDDEIDFYDVFGEFRAALGHLRDVSDAEV